MIRLIKYLKAWFVKIKANFNGDIIYIVAIKDYIVFCEKCGEYICEDGLCSNPVCPNPMEGN